MPVPSTREGRGFPEASGSVPLKASEKSGAFLFLSAEKLKHRCILSLNFKSLVKAFTKC